MKREIFKTRVAVANCSGAMEADTIQNTGVVVLPAKRVEGTKKQLGI